MKIYNICVRKTYQKDGVEKVSWPQVGTMIHFPPNGEKGDGYKIEIPILGATQLFVFEAVERGARKEVVKEIQMDEGEVKAEDVPW